MSASTVNPECVRACGERQLPARPAARTCPLRAETSRLKLYALKHRQRVNGTGWTDSCVRIKKSPSATMESPRIIPFGTKDYSAAADRCCTGSVKPSGCDGFAQTGPCSSTPKPRSQPSNVATKICDQGADHLFQRLLAAGALCHRVVQDRHLAG